MLESRQNKLLSKRLLGLVNWTLEEYFFKELLQEITVSEDET